MLKIYYTVINSLPQDEVLHRKLQTLPRAFQEKISAYKKPMDKVLQVCGKLLLKELLAIFGLDNSIGLDNIAFGKNNKPHFNNVLYFNGGRSGNIAICAATTDGDVGIDIEKIAPVELDVYEEYFTAEEWNAINTGPNSLEKFFALWTKKEAVAKAAGLGMFANLAEFAVLEDVVRINGVDYFVKNIGVPHGYVCHVACAFENTEMEVGEVEVFEGV